MENLKGFFQKYPALAEGQDRESVHHSFIIENKEMA